MTRFMKSFALIFALGGATACGEELADGTYTGEARYTVSGEVQSLTPVDVKGTTRVALVWDNWARSGDILTLQSVEVSSKNPPFDYQLRLMEDPPTSALNNFKPGLMGTAYVLIYEDLNGDATYTEEDDVARGIAPGHIVLFAPEVTPELKESLRRWRRIVNVDDLKPGFNLARGICNPGDFDDNGYTVFDDLQIVSTEPVPVEDMDAKGCLNFH
ncbi:hypothetical protein F0U60_46445 [Archangium minus]|uniref:Lipoprotein n=1 Tax=Archangium minus TaxID=83450 RepID=A0ABY9X5R8_9BACT|nr:hypothetical protein F0U60_46445 [Archangium minus]